MLNLSSIIKTTNIIKINPEDILSHALAQMATSHDAAFVFDKDNKFHGIINPYYCLIKSSYPSNTKVKHCLNHPPRIYIDFSLEKVAQFFVESKIHYLPVFDRQEKFLGIISARRLLFNLKDKPILNVKINDILKEKNKPIVAVYENDSVSKAVSLFKSTKYSKLIVINGDLKLRGILSYYDLISFMITSRKSNKKGDRKSNKVHYLNHQVKNFVKTSVLTLSKENTLSQAARLIIDKKIGSVIIIDEERHPIGVITTKDLLRLFIKKQEKNIVSRFSSRIGKLLLRK